MNYKSLKSTPISSVNNQDYIMNLQKHSHLMYYHYMYTHWLNVVIMDKISSIDMYITEQGLTFEYLYSNNSAHT